MPVLNIGGKRVTVDDSFLSLTPEQQNKTVDEIAQSMPSAPEQPQPEQEAHLGHKVGATIDGIAQGLTFGYSDEIAAGLDSGFGLAGDYDKSLEAERARMDENKRLAGGYELGGNIAGGVATAGGLMKSGISLLPRISNPLAAAAAEAAAYGAAHGSGTAREGDRIEGAATGAAVGGLTGGLVQKAGSTVANALSKNKNIIPGVEQLAQKTGAMYEKMRNAGAVIKQKSGNRLLQNFKFTAGKQNINLRPKTIGMLQDAEEILKGDVDFEALHDLSMKFNRVLRKGIDEDDAHVVRKMKKQLDYFIENIKAKDLASGTPDSVSMLRQADKLYARQKKTELIETLLDNADVQTGQYTQSGMANTVVREMRKLYKNKKLLSGFSKEEQALIRQMAKGGSSSTVINLLAKFAPRGVVSSVLSTGAGMGMAGPAGLALPLAGHLAGKQADRAAVSSMGALRNMAASGAVPKALPNPLRRAIAPASQTTSRWAVEQRR